MADQPPNPMMVTISRAQDRVRIILLPAHPDRILAEILFPCSIMRAIDILPRTVVDARYLIGPNAYHFSILGVEFLNRVDQSTALHGTHVGEAGYSPETWAWEFGEWVVV
jgi:hypothetical protein